MVLQNESKKYQDIAVLLENGSLYVNIIPLLFKNDEEKLTIAATSRSEKINGRILKIVSDQQNNKWFYILSAEGM